MRLPARTAVHGVSRSRDKLDLFATDVNGVIRTASWEPSFSDGWRGWREINGGRAMPGAPVTAVSRRKDNLDVFVVGQDGRVWTAAWEPSFTDRLAWLVAYRRVKQAMVSRDRVYEYKRAISENARGTLLMHDGGGAAANGLDGGSHGVHHLLLAEPTVHALR